MWSVFVSFVLFFCVESVLHYPLLPLNDVKGEKYLYIPTAVDSKGVILLHHPSWSIFDSLFVMFHSFGYAAETASRASLPEYIDTIQGLYKTYIEDKSNAAILQHNASELQVVVPITLRKSGTVVYLHKNEDIATVVQNYIDQYQLNVSSADFGRIMKQFSVRKSKSLKQAIAFPFPDTNQFISGYSTDICTATTPYHRAIGSIPSMAQLYVNKALHDDIFNIFVINLWSNFIRRNYMTQQFSRSDMRPVYYAPGVDAMFMAVNITKNIVNNETIIIQTHLAAAIAHYQIWKEIVENDLAFGIIFEDDVDLDTDVAKCVIKEAISQLIREPETADNWSILYLDYSSEHNFSEEAIENKLNETCIDAARLHAPGASNTTVNIVRMSEYCSSGSTRAYVVSYHGARQLIRLLEDVKIKTNMDVFFRDMIYFGNIEAYAIVNPVATSKPSLFNLNNVTVGDVSQMNGRCVKIDRTTGLLVETWRPGDEITCDTEPCLINM